MKNIEFRATNKFGSTYREKFNGRKFTRLVAKEVAERNICEYQVLIEFVKYHIDKYYSNEEITNFEFTWLDRWNYRHTISKSDYEL